MKHIIVAREEGRFLGWPANDGVWSWADEIVVGYTNGTPDFGFPEQLSSYSCMPMLDLRFSKQRGVIRCLN